MEFFEPEQQKDTVSLNYLRKLANGVIESYQRKEYRSRQEYMKFILGTIICVEDANLGYWPETLDYSPADKLNIIHDEQLKTSADSHKLWLGHIGNIYPANYTTEQWRNFSRILAKSLYLPDGKPLVGSMASKMLIMEGLANGTFSIKLSINNEG